VGALGTAASALRAGRSVDDEVEALLWDETAFVASCDALASLVRAAAAGEGDERQAVLTSSAAVLTSLLEAHASLRRMCCSPWFRGDGRPVTERQAYGLLRARRTPLRMLQASYSAVVGVVEAVRSDVPSLPLRPRHRDALSRLLAERDETLPAAGAGRSGGVRGDELLWTAPGGRRARPTGMLEPSASAAAAVRAAESWCLARIAAVASRGHAAGEDTAAGSAGPDPARSRAELLGAQQFGTQSQQGQAGRSSSSPRRRRAAPSASFEDRMSQGDLDG